METNDLTADYEFSIDDVGGTDVKKDRRPGPAESHTASRSRYAHRIRLLPKNTATGGGTISTSLPTLSPGMNAQNLFIRASTQTGATDDSSTVNIASLTIGGDPITNIGTRLTVLADHTDYDGIRIVQITSPL